MNYVKRTIVQLICMPIILCSISAYGMDMNTDIFQAAETGNVAKIQELLKSGVNPNVTNSYGWTPLLSAAYFCHKEIVEILVRARADVDKQNNHGSTPLILACCRGQKEIVKILLRAGATVNKNNNDGETPLYEAAYYGHKEVIEILVIAGADVNKQDRKGDTPLHRAALYNSKEIIEILLRAGADADLKNKYGKTAWDWSKDKAFFSDTLEHIKAERAIRFASGMHERLGKHSPLQLLVGFGHLAHYIAAYGLSAKETKPELL